MDIKEIPNAIDSASSVKQLVVNLFYGWGYNAYADENKNRSDSLLIRGELSAMLSSCVGFINAAEMEYRRSRLQQPTRDNPFPNNKDALSQCEKFETIKNDLSTIETKIRTAPSPTNDRVWQRHRNHSELLKDLLEADRDMSEKVVSLVYSCVSCTTCFDDINLRITDVNAAIQDRNGILSIFNT